LKKQSKIGDGSILAEPEMKIKDTEIKIAMGDITGLKVDAIVNAANNKLVMGGGLAAAIRKKGGKVIEDEAVKKGPIEIGEAVATKAGSLAAKYVIHAATMGMDFKTDEIKIRDSCRNALRVAEELKISSVAFPALGCGVGGFPLLAAAKIMAQEVMRHLREDKTTLKEIVFCLYDKEAYDIFNKGIFSYIDYMTNKLQKGPFTTVDAIIEINGGIVLIQRSNPPFGWALPGGFVDYGESLEEAVRREMKEETGLDLEDLKQFHTYSEAGRDVRFHTIATVFIAKAKGKSKAGDDAAGLKIVKLNEIEKIPFAFDHKKILQDYLKYKKGENPF
jgi:O-acetyl-ADP-ribose deacetylase (regulator of RNase III)/ADP-ribose pyrophosphatase YjhB (NUDIX family)